MPLWAIAVPHTPHPMPTHNKPAPHSKYSTTKGYALAGRAGLLIAREVKFCGA